MDEPVVTMASATIPADADARLIAAYRSVTSVLPAELIESFLLRGENHEWRIVSVWRNSRQLEQYRHAVGVPPAIQMLRAAGGNPVLVTFDVVARVGHDLLGARSPNAQSGR